MARNRQFDRAGGSQQTRNRRVEERSVKCASSTMHVHSMASLILKAGVSMWSLLAVCTFTIDIMSQNLGNDVVEIQVTVSFPKDLNYEP